MVIADLVFVLSRRLLLLISLYQLHSELLYDSKLDLLLGLPSDVVPGQIELVYFVAELDLLAEVHVATLDWLLKRLDDATVMIVV